MKRFIEGVDRSQATFFPEHLEDWIDGDNPVRFVDAFVEGLDFSGLGFADAAATDRPGYHPSVLLKLYIYAYLNQVQSSRRLEREAGRNVEVMWLTGRLLPDHKTIADFRKDNGAAIREVCAQFVQLCREIGLLATSTVAIDGSKFKAVNNRDRNFTKAKMQRRQDQITNSIARYLDQLDTNDRRAPSEAQMLKRERLTEKIAMVREKMARLKELEAEMLASPDEQLSLTDPDSRSMTSNGSASGTVGYNVQAAVDPEHHLIVAHDVISKGSDRAQLVPMANQARTVLGVDEITVVADRGYYSGEQLLECANSNITAYVPKALTSRGIKRGLFTKQDFVYDADNDWYVCPAGQKLTKGGHRSDRRGDINFYRHLTACSACALKSRCTTEKLRRIRRWDHEDVLDDVERRLDAAPEMMKMRRSTVEHPFATMKAWMGATHFLTRTRKRVATEMSLHVLAYNIKRVLKIIGIGPILAALKAA